MTDDDKKRIAEYMGWCLHENWDNSGEPFDTGACLNCGASIFNAITRNFDLNDAALVVQEMQKRGEWVYFYDDLLDTYNGLCEDGKVSCGAENFSAWLFNSENFFKAFVEWRKKNER